MLLRARTERKLLAVNKNAACTKDAERRTKGVCEPGKLGGEAGRIFQPSAIPNRDRWPVNERQPES